MKRTHHTGMVEGVGTAVGAVILASVGFLAGCAPGTICDKPGYENECLTGGSGGSASGSGGSGGSMSSGTGGMMPAATGGMGGSSGPRTAPACKLYASKEEVAEKIVVAKCAKPGGPCHATTFPPKYTNSAEALTAMLDKAPSLVCRNDKLINKAEPWKSFIVTKVRGNMMTVTCPTGTGMNNGGAKMPFMPDPPLSADEADCLEWWAFEVSK
jgi:hypothetical protein